MIEWLLVQVPWWVYAVAGLVVVGVVYRTWGWHGTIAAIAALGSILGYQRAYKQGYNARERAGDRETDRAIRNANEGRKNADTSRDHDDGFRRD